MCGKWRFLLSKEGLKRVEVISLVLCLPWRRGTCSHLRIIPFSRKLSPVALWKLHFQVLTCGFLSQQGRGGARCLVRSQDDIFSRRFIFTLHQIRPTVDRDG